MMQKRSDGQRQKPAQVDGLAACKLAEMTDAEYEALDLYPDE